MLSFWKKLRRRPIDNSEMLERLNTLGDAIDDHAKALTALQQAVWRIEKKQYRWLEALGINPKAEDQGEAVKVASQQPVTREPMAGDEIEVQQVE
ncbi:hypothetical protein ES703_73149 [subsurface metagenome]